MTTIRRSVGVGAILMAFLGLLLCTAGIAGVWVGKSYLDPMNDALFATADEAFEFMETRLHRVQQTLNKSRERVRDISVRAGRLKTMKAEASIEFVPLFQTLDELLDDLTSAEQWLDASQAIARGVNRVSETVASSETADLREKSDGLTARKVEEFSAAVVDAIARLELVRQEFIDVRDKGELARRTAATVIIRLTDLDERLGQVSARILKFNAKVSATRASSVELGQRIHWWTAFATVMLVLVMFWFAISQIGMMKHGWRFARSSASP